MTPTIVSAERLKELKDQYLSATIAMVKEAFKTEDDMYALAERMIILTAINEQQEQEIHRLSKMLTSKTK